MSSLVRDLRSVLSVAPELAEFEASLLGTGQRLQHELRLSAMISWITRLLLMIVASFVIDRWLRLSVSTRVVLALAGFIWLATGVYRVWRETRALTRDPRGLAAALDRQQSRGSGQPDLTQQLATLADLATRRGRGEGDSEELLHLAVERARDSWRSHDWSIYRNRTLEHRRRLVLVALILIPMGAIALNSESASLWFRRWFMGSDARWPQSTWLQVEGMKDGRMIVPRGEPVEIRASATAASKVVPDRVVIRWEIDDSRENEVDMVAMAPNDFRIDLGGVMRSGKIWLRGGDDHLGPLSIEARARPRIRKFTLYATLPEVGTDERLELTGQDRDLSYRARTQLRVDCEADQILSEFALENDTAATRQIERVSDRVFSVRWLHTERTHLSFRLRAAGTGLESTAQELQIGLDLDRVPRVQLEIQGVRDRITPQAYLPTSVLAQDDHGVMEARLELGVGALPVEAQSKTSRTLTLYEYDASTGQVLASVKGGQDLEISELGLAVGGFLVVRGVAIDQCHLGAQTGRSRPRMFRIVEPTIIYREITGRLQIARARFRLATAAAREVELALTKAPDPPSLTELTRRHRLLERQVWATERVFAASARELILNRLVQLKAEQMLQDQVLSPLDALLKGRLRVQRVALENAQGDQSAKRVELAGGQTAIRRDMDAILESMRAWDSFVDLVNQLEEVIDLQRQTRKETMSPPRGQTMAVSRICWCLLILTSGVVAQDEARKAQIEFRQRQVLRQMEGLEDRMFQLSEAVRDTEPDHAARLVLGLQRSREDLLVEDMAEIASLIQGGKLDEAEERQRRVLFQLDELRELLLSTDLDLLLKLERLRKLNRALKRIATVTEESKAVVERLRSSEKSDAAGAMAGAEIILRESGRSVEILRSDVAAVIGGNEVVLDALERASRNLLRAADRLGDDLATKGVEAGDAAQSALDEAVTELRAERKRLLRELQAFIRRHLSETLLQMQDRQQRVTVAVEALLKRQEAGRLPTTRSLKQMSDHEVEFATRARNAVQLIEETEYSVTFPLFLTVLRELSEDLSTGISATEFGPSFLAESGRLEGHCQEALQILIEESKWARRADMQNDAQFQYIKLITELTTLRLVQIRAKDDTERLAGEASNSDLTVATARIARWQLEARLAMKALEERGDSELLKRLIAEQDEDL